MKNIINMQACGWRVQGLTPTQSNKELDGILLRTESSQLQLQADFGPAVMVNLKTSSTASISQELLLQV